MIYHILSYLPARDLKTIRLVNKILSQLGQKNTFWSNICSSKWSEKLCLTTLPLPSATLPSHDDDEDDEMTEDIEIETPTIEEYLSTMTNFPEHTYDELKPGTLHSITTLFPAYTLVEGSWMRAYNLIERNMSVTYLYQTVRRDNYSISDTQWEL